MSERKPGPLEWGQVRCLVVVRVHALWRVRTSRGGHSANGSNDYPLVPGGKHPEGHIEWAKVTDTEPNDYEKVLCWLPTDVGPAIGYRSSDGVWHDRDGYTFWQMAKATHYARINPPEAKDGADSDR